MYHMNHELDVVCIPSVSVIRLDVYYIAFYIYAYVYFSVYIIMFNSISYSVYTKPPVDAYGHFSFSLKIIGFCKVHSPTNALLLI